MTTRQKVAAKHVNVLDRVIDVQRTLVPPHTVITRVDREDPDPIFSRTKPTPWFGGAMDEFDDRTLGSLVGTGLQGQ